MTRREIHLRAMKLAASTHRELGTDLKEQVDIYLAIERLGVTLAFEQLEDLSGAYLPAADNTGGLAGIIINERHPRSRQRYTAGHELGHHLRDGVHVADRETDFLGRSSTVRDERELAADAFASWFLMPRLLVRHLARELHLGDQQTPEQIYTLSLRLGTSYLATATHLVNLAMLGPAAYRRAIAVTPKWIKAQLGVHGPGDSWGDVWRIRQDGDASSATPQPGDEIVIELTEIPSTGYIWQLERSPHRVSLIETTFEAPEDNEGEESYGASGTRLLTLRVEEPGITEVDVVKRHPWEPNAEAVERFSVKLAIAEKERGFLPVPATA